MLGGHILKCQYCNAKTFLKSPEQLAELFKKKGDSNHYFDGNELKCRKCGNKILCEISSEKLIDVKKEIEIPAEFNFLCNYPKSCLSDSEYDCGFEIITANRKTKAMGQYHSIAGNDNLIKEHVTLINKVISDNIDKQCYVRIMPECFIDVSGLKGYYTRLQFKVVKPDESK
jgi:hypothetical protein